MALDTAQKISLLPFKEDFKNASPAVLRADIIAGLTVAVFAIPQAMAYAMLAGLPPQYGLYSAIVLSIVAALWGSSHYINTGPTNSAALLTAAALAPFSASSEVIGLAFTLCLLVGFWRCLFGLLKFGRLVNFVPESAFLGFTAGAGLLIALGQLHHLLGVEASHANGFPRKVYETLIQAPSADLVPLLVGLGTLVAMLSLNRFRKRIPVALLVIMMGTLISYFLKEGHPISTVGDISPIAASLPSFQTPLYMQESLPRLITASLAIAIIGLIEAVSIGQVLALKHDRKLNFNQEFFGQGLSHLVGSLFQCFPGSGSFSRSSLIEQAGGQTRIANIVFGLGTALAMLSIPGLLNLIPIASLAGLLLFIGILLIDPSKIKRVWITSKEDAAIMLITFCITVGWRIEYGIYAGVVLGAMMMLNRSAPLRLCELLPTGEGNFSEVSYTGKMQHPEKSIVIASVAGDLFYGQAAALRDHLKEIVQTQKPEVLIIRVRRSYSIDYSCWSALFDFAKDFYGRGGQLYLCGVREDYMRIVQAAKMDCYVPEEQVFPQRPEVYAALKAALAQARIAVGETHAESETD